MVVCRFLALDRLNCATTVFEWLQTHGAVPDTPLCNYISFLLEALGYHSSQLFKVLRGNYKASIARDVMFEKVGWKERTLGFILTLKVQYLNKIGTVFFDFPSTDNSLGGLISSMMQGMMGGTA